MNVIRSSADGLTASNQTNLAIKGIIAIEAMSKMSSVIQQGADVSKYAVSTGLLATVATLIRPQSAAAQLYDQWKGLALSSAQYVLAAYGETSTWTLGYNLFADVWLGTNLVDSSVGVHVC